MEEIEKLLNKKENGYLNVNTKEIFEFSEKYIRFLNKSKIEREAIISIISELKQNGFKELNEYETLKQNDKVYYINRGKSLYAAIIGQEKIENGLNIIGSHVDSPRLDLKPNPLYEDSELALFKTHYYGGIKTYQWVNIPLAIHGVIIKKNGEKITLNIGEKEDDPIFTITDLLPHLAKKQEKKTLGEGIEGEDLNLLVGSIPYNTETLDNKVKLNILAILNRKFGITEKELLSAEIELVPAFNAKSLGFDESMVASYGQDDKACVYASLEALIHTNNPKKTSLCIFSDKEEIGSMGNTGMSSETFEYFVSEILNKIGNKPNLLNKVFCHSKMLSADVDGAFDPTYADVSEKNNNSFLNYGVVLNKYTGSGGKYNASDANAEYIAYIRNILENENIKYQVSELGKIGAGGGGTIAYILANKGIDVIDCGIPVLSMHSPYEVISKFDIYEAYKTYKVFFKN